ncbi:MAG TPA: hypothetical protein VKG23_07385 [Thermoanaerobaculia bacterium]|nr:hypothetical protein [Thermoanaerobaculia bacterium]
MPRSWLARASLLAAALMVAMVAAFWGWALVTGWLGLGSRSPGGAVVTATLWKLFLVGVPVAGFLALLAGLLGAFRRRHSWFIAAVIGGLVAAIGTFWLWSLIGAGL